MTHFIERKDLIRWVEQNCTRKSVVRAMQEGSVENLGMFSNIGPTPCTDGWIVRVKSERGKVWLLEIVPTGARKFGIYITECMTPDDSVLWEYWCPCDPSFGINPLYAGDNPTEYGRLRDERRN